MNIQKYASCIFAALMISGVLSVSGFAFETNFTESLECLFNDREKIFEDSENVHQLRANAALSDNFIKQEQDHAAFINTWKNSLGIEIFDATVFYSVIDTLDQTDAVSKLAVYEWVDIDYMFPSEGFTRTMGFGTNHILKIDLSAGNAQILEDSYIEITGFETGNFADLEVLRDILNDDDLGIEVQVGEISNHVETYEGLTSSSYNHANAVAYSNQWCGYYAYHATDPGSAMHPSAYNPYYYYYSGADCCNFVSQCILAGGKSTSGDWWVTPNPGAIIPVDDSSYTKSGSAWRYTPSFKNYWASQGYTIYNFTSTSQAGAGNPMFWLASDGYSTNHAMLIVASSSTENVVFVNAHNSDCYCYPRRLSDMTFYTLWF